ncbi:MAG: FAD binding domain-containing protein [Thermaurantiacus sp.]
MSLHPVFARPTSLGQASELLAGLSAGGVLIAGGQEIMPHVNHGVLQPSVFVDIGSLQELRGIRFDDGIVRIGALTVHRELQTDPVVAEHVPLLAHAANKAGGGRQVHNRGTIGGNIVAMHPLYDLAPSLLALEAEVEVLREDKSRCIAFADLLRDTSLGLGSEAILVRISVRAIPPGVGWAYEKLKLSGGAYGSANAVALVGVSGGRLSSLRIVVGAVADWLVDASEALSGLVGQAPSERLADEIEARVPTLVGEPLDDHQGPGEWRRAMAGVVARRAFLAAMYRAG